MYRIKPQAPAILSAVDFTAPRPGWASGLAYYTRRRREELAGCGKTSDLCELCPSLVTE